MTSSLTQAKFSEITRILRERDTETKKLKSVIKSFRKSVADRHQLVQKLYNATVYVVRKTAVATTSVDVLIASMSITDATLVLLCDRRVTTGS